jgi:hypothetical protein
VSGALRPAARSACSAAALALVACGRDPPPSRFPDGAAALARMKATYACANGVFGKGKLDHFSGRGRVRGNIHVFAVNPARVYIDVPSTFGGMLYTLTSDGKRFQLLDVQEKRFLEGPASACNLARITQVPVPGHALVTLLRGEAPLLVHEPGAAVLRWEASRWRVEIASTRAAREVVELEVYDEDWQRPWAEQRVRVTRVRVEQRGAVVYDAVLTDHAATHTAGPRIDEDGLAPPIPPSGGACRAEVPRAIRIEVPSTGDDVIFRYDEVVFNPPLLKGTFAQRPPEGVRVEEASCKD